MRAEEKRHLNAAKRVPDFFKHKYELDARSEEYLRQAKEAEASAVHNAVNDLDSVDSNSPERD